MAITNIKVSNFKSFKDLGDAGLNLGQLNVVVGANASGKSNFVQVFRFLRNIQNNNLDDALSMSEGFQSIFNVKAEAAADLRLEVEVDLCGVEQPPTTDHQATAQVVKLIYSCALGLREKQAFVRKEILKQRLSFDSQIAREDSTSVYAELTVSNDGGRVSIQTDPPEDKLEELLKSEARTPAGRFLFVPQFYQEKIARYKSLLIRTPHLFNWPSAEPCGSIGVYDVDPRSAKKPHETAGIARLQENGENLVLVLKQILADPEKSRKFHNLLGYMLPFAKEVGVEQYLGVSLLLKLREEYHNDSLLANLLSDGTVDVVALVVALFFEDKDVVIIEEPERNLHPHLISGLMRLLEDAARNKQIIITTHSPEVVKHSGVDNLLLISRDKEGFSTVSRPAEKEDVKVFLENDLGLDTVFVQELWGR